MNVLSIISLKRFLTTRYIFCIEKVKASEYSKHHNLQNELKFMQIIIWHIKR